MSVLFSVCDLVSKNIVALIGSSKSDTFSLMVSQTRAFKLPFIVPTLTRESSSPKDSYVVSICPSFIDVVIDFIKYFEWNRIFYLYDTDDGECIFPSVFFFLLFNIILLF